MLESVEWGEFRLGDLFEIKSNPQLDKGNFVFSEKAEYPYFTRTAFNNGILGNVEYLDEEHKMQGGCLAVGMIAMQFFYMEKDFYAGQFTKRAIPKKFTLTSRLANYFITVLNKKQKIFQAVLVRNFEKVFKTEKVQLPIKNGSLHLDFMENFVAEL
ncbi:MAG: restriction endonuclease subunit M, partial [Kingella sp. (in: b-proteobacteria)]